MGERSGTETRQRTHQLGLRLNQEEQTLLDETAARTGLTPPEVMRRCLRYAAAAIVGDNAEPAP